MAQPPLLIQEGNSVSRFVCMNARTTKCQNWRRHADTIAHKSEKMANLQSRALARVGNPHSAHYLNECRLLRPKRFLQRWFEFLGPRHPQSQRAERLGEADEVGIDQIHRYATPAVMRVRSEEHTSELQSQSNLVCRLLLEKKKKKSNTRCT